MNKILLLCVVLCFAGCVTGRVWKETDPDGFVAVKKEIFDEELRGKTDLHYYERGDGYVYVKKSNIQKVKDYTIRTVTTPITISIDAVSVVVVGTLYVSGISATSPEFWLGVAGGFR